MSNVHPLEESINMIINIELGMKSTELKNHTEHPGKRRVTAWFMTGSVLCVFKKIKNALHHSSHQNKAEKASLPGR